MIVAVMKFARFATKINSSKYGTPSFYGWSENVARRLAENSDLDNLKNFLTARGFDLT